MKKTFRFLALSFALICGTLSSFATVDQPAQGPKTDGTAKVGSTVSSGLVVYKVTGWNGNVKSNGGTEVGAYTVEITGLNADGLEKQSKGELTELTIQTNFKEMFGEIYCNYVVTKISDASIDNKVAFYALTKLTKLEFVNDKDTKDVAAPQDFEIGEYAFYGCTKLATLVFPDNVKKIGAYAFQNSGISTFEIPANCATIGENAFNNCQSLNTVTVRTNKDEDGNELGGELTALTGKVFANSSLKVLDLEKAWKLTTIGATDNSPFLYKVSDVNNQLQSVILPKIPTVAAGKVIGYSNIVSEIYNSFKNCTALIQVKNLEISAIETFAGDAFNNCQVLPELNFPKGTQGVGMLTGTPFVDCPKLATLTFAEGFAGTVGNGTDNLYGTAATDLAALTTVTFGSTTGTISGNAFGNATKEKACSGLTTVTFGELQAKATISGGSFQNCASLATLTFNGMNIAATAGDDIAIYGDAFTGTALTSVDLKNISVLSEAGGKYVLIDGNVFSSDALTSFTVGNITVTSGNSVTLGNGLAVACKATSDGADVLKSVKFGDITTDGSVYVKSDAFKSAALSSVEIGKLAKKTPKTSVSELIYIGTNAFANSAEGVDAAETIKIGDISANTTIYANAFKGAQLNVPGKKVTYTATLGSLKAADDAAATIAIYGGAFNPAKVSEVSYTIGDVVAATGDIAASAFVGGTTDGTAPNTTVNVGAYQTAFSNVSAFTNVNDLIVKSWDAPAYVSTIGVPVTLTVTGNVTQTLAGDGSENKITDLIFGGNITQAGAITSFGNKVRNIIFSGTDQDVVKHAFASNAFESASSKAKTDKEVVSVIYMCETEGKYNPIFTADAFGDNSIEEAVILYTTEWARDNIFLNDKVYPTGVNRMTFLASEITPSEAPSAQMVAAKNGQYKYGRLYVPQGTGMYYKVSAKVSGGKNTVNLFSGHLDGDNIYMKQVDVYNGYYWIDANDKAQVFIVRTSDLTAETVESEKASDEEIADWKSTNPENVYWFAKTDAIKNCLRYATAKVINTQLQNDNEFKQKTIYVMANPAKNNLAFAQLNQYATPSRDLPAGSIYVISQTNPQVAAARLNVIFEDGIEEEATGIKTLNVENDMNGDTYDLRGVRVNAAYKGLVIKNGKKMIQK
jgi:hypothetical protein